MLGSAGANGGGPYPPSPIPHWCPPAILCPLKELSCLLCVAPSSCRRLDLSGDELAACMAACAAIFRSRRRAERRVQQQQTSPGPAARDASDLPLDHPEKLPHRAGPMQESHQAMQVFAKALLGERGARVRRATGAARVQALQALQAVGRGTSGGGALGTKASCQEQQEASLLLPLLSMALDVARAEVEAALASARTSGIPGGPGGFGGGVIEGGHRAAASIAGFAINNNASNSSEAWADGGATAAAADAATGGTCGPLAATAISGASATQVVHPADTVDAILAGAVRLVYSAAKMDVEVGVLLSSGASRWSW